MSVLADVLDAMTVEGELYRRREDGAVECFACGHRCLIRPGRRGICKVRFNEGGVLRVPWGYVGALQCDPTEKKPFFHLLPGSDTLTFGMLGCDFHCPYCQNWVTSQALRDPASEAAGAAPRRVTPADLVAGGVAMGAQVIASSYNEPLITSEWSRAIFEEARRAGLICAYVSNGNATPEVLEYLRPWVRAYKVDLKTMRDAAYRRLGGVLDHVLETIRMAHAAGFWVEVVTLIVPGFNDSTEELMDAARFLVSVSPDIPWHVTAFHKDYKMPDPDNTTASALIRAAEIGQEAGLRYVYAGNLPGQVGSYEDTTCPACGTVLVQRLGYVILGYHLTASGTCPRCGTSIPGTWTSDPGHVRLGAEADLFVRVPRRVR
ncbi:MAG TPA: AmmeMemoRadiSam system radical SAM enzyme [Anaerolineales bacterium]|nr:AmmeMemoRadiSam system radical SAM enzyme [Anaerolineales bacterium]